MPSAVVEIVPGNDHVDAVDFRHDPLFVLGRTFFVGSGGPLVFGHCRGRPAIHDRRKLLQHVQAGLLGRIPFGEFRVLGRQPVQQLIPLGLGCAEDVGVFRIARFVDADGGAVGIVSDVGGDGGDHERNLGQHSFLHGHILAHGIPGVLHGLGRIGRRELEKRRHAVGNQAVVVGVDELAGRQQQVGRAFRGGNVRHPARFGKAMNRAQDLDVLGGKRLDVGDGVVIGVVVDRLLDDLGEPCAVLVRNAPDVHQPGVLAVENASRFLQEKQGRTHSFGCLGLGKTCRTGSRYGSFCRRGRARRRPLLRAALHAGRAGRSQMIALCVERRRDVGDVHGHPQNDASARFKQRTGQPGGFARPRKGFQIGSLIERYS